MVDQLQAADTTDVEPMANPLDATQRLRPDEVTEGNRREEFQADRAGRGRRPLPRAQGHRLTRPANTGIPRNATRCPLPSSAPGCEPRPFPASS